MHANVQFEFFGDLFQRQNPWYMRGKCDNKEWALNREHPFPRVSKIQEKAIDITEFRVYHEQFRREFPIIVIQLFGSQRHCFVYDKGILH